MIISILSVLGLAGVTGAALFVTANYSTKVLMITPNPREAVELDKMLWEEGDPVADIYGVPLDESKSILFADPSRIIYPVEDDSLVLYTVDKESGENPLQEKTVWFVTRWAVIGFGLLGAVSISAALLLYRRQ